MLSPDSDSDLCNSITITSLTSSKAQHSVKYTATLSLNRNTSKAPFYLEGLLESEYFPENPFFKKQTTNGANNGAMSLDT